MRYLLLLTLLISTHSFAITKSDLKTGDILLLPISCYQCSMIEQETNSPYSHSGIVLKGTDGSVEIAQSLKNVHTLSYDDFLRMKDPTRSIRVMRSKELISDNSKRSALVENYYEIFAGATFDHDYLWDNYDEDGRESYYCSEFIKKLINTVLTDKLLPAPHYYTSNLEYWKRYFSGNIPQGEPSNSPAAFQSYSQLIDLGLLK